MTHRTLRNWLGDTSRRCGRRLSRLDLEPLEDRSTPAAVGWDGGGGILDWFNRFNWTGDALPTIARQGITLVGVSLTNLDDDGVIQLPLPFERQSLTALDTTLDDLRGRFGATAVTRAVLLGRDPGMSVPLLPD